MKTILYITTLFLVIAGLSGCEKEVKDFDGEEGVYFYVQWGVDWYDTTYWAAQPYTKVEFIKKGVDEVQLKVRVQVTGRVKDYDRKFRIIVDQDSTTAVEGENYLPIEEWQTLEKGWNYKDVLVTVKNSAALDEVERHLVLQLMPSEELPLAIPVWHDFSDMLKNDSKNAEFDGTRHEIILNNFITCPQKWMGPAEGKQGQAEGGLWGIFSKEKYEEIIKRFPDLTYEDFMSAETMPSGLQYAIQNKMVIDLQKLYDAGTPIKEKDGRLMWFLGVSWKSYYGVPYRPEE